MKTNLTKTTSFLIAALIVAQASPALAKTRRQSAAQAQSDYDSSVAAYNDQQRQITAELNQRDAEQDKIRKKMEAENAARMNKESALAAERARTVKEEAALPVKGRLLGRETEAFMHAVRYADNSVSITVTMGGVQLSSSRIQLKSPDASNLIFFLQQEKKAGSAGSIEVQPFVRSNGTVETQSFFFKHDGKVFDQINFVKAYGQDAAERKKSFASADFKSFFGMTDQLWQQAVDGKHDGKYNQPVLKDGKILPGTNAVAAAAKSGSGQGSAGTIN